MGSTESYNLGPSDFWTLVGLPSLNLHNSDTRRSILNIAASAMRVADPAEAHKIALHAHCLFPDLKS